jgi:hypothetical protein
MAIGWLRFRGAAFDFLFDTAARTRELEFLRTGLVFRTLERCVARLDARVTAGGLWFSTFLRAGLLAVPVVTGLAAEMGAAGKTLAAERAAGNGVAPTGDRRDPLLAALAELLGQVRTLGAVFLVRMTFVLDRWVATGWRPGARVVASRRLRAAGDRWLD